MLHTNEYGRRCKICSSPQRLAIDFLHFARGYSYRKLIRTFTGWAVPNLNLANLSVHFNRHVDDWEKLMLWDMAEAEIEKNVDLTTSMNAFMFEWYKKRWQKRYRD